MKPTAPHRLQQPQRPLPIIQAHKAYNKPNGAYISAEEFCTVTNPAQRKTRLLLT